MSQISVDQIVDVNGGNAVQINGVTPTAESMQGFRNRIINGDMRIDQRNAGASVTPTNGQYLVDRFYAVLTQASKFSAQQNAGAVTPPTGFSNYQGVTSLSAYSILTGDAFSLRQSIEGFNVSDLGWGTASAQAVTVSFWTRSTLTGSFGANIANSAFTRSYPFSYTISSANTWEYKTIVIPGETTGTWLMTNGTGMHLTFGLGYGASLSGTANVWNAGTGFMPTGATSVVGTSGATFYITGVQLEAGSVATPFERRPYSTELQLAQRYYQKTYDQNAIAGSTSTGIQGSVWSSNPVTNSYPNLGTWNFATPMRAVPTVTGYNPSTGASGGFRGDGTNFAPLSVTAAGERSVSFFGNNTPVGTSVFMNVHAVASAEL